MEFYEAAVADLTQPAYSVEKPLDMPYALLI
jgi:hypothetical protein